MGWGTAGDENSGPGSTLTYNQAMNWDHYQPTVRVKFTFGAPCICCRHFIGAGACTAFPFGIPAVILDGRHDHRTTHYRGDGGLLWESGLHLVEEVTDGGPTLEGHTQGQAPEAQQGQGTEGA